jgi:hypothetical protein
MVSRRLMSGVGARSDPAHRIIRESGGVPILVSDSLRQPVPREFLRRQAKEGRI